jgi:hypothetical protein
MPSEIAKGDQNNYRTITGVTNDANEYIRIFRVDPVSGGLVVGGTIQNAGYTSVTSGTDTCASTTTGAGVVVIPTPCQAVVISVPINNTGTEVCIGGSNVSAIAGSEIGHIIIKGGSQLFNISDASNLYWIADTVGDKISYNIFN